MKIEEVTMTPALATKLLEGNTGNRRLDPKRVKALVTALTNGEYQFDGTPIRIGPGGLVLDGQHRLEAVRASSVSIPVLLITEMASSVQMVLDTGKPRSFVDYLTIEGVQNCTNIAGTAKLLWHYEHRDIQTTSGWSYRPTPSHAALWAFYQERDAEIIQGVKRATPVRRRVRVMPSVAATAYIVFSRIDEEDADAFYSELDFSEPAGAPVALWMKTLNARRDRSRRDYTQQEQMALLIKTWNMYRHGTIVEKLAWMQSPKKREKFPVPDGEEEAGSSEAA